MAGDLLKDQMGSTVAFHGWVHVRVPGRVGSTGEFTQSPPEHAGRRSVCAAGPSLRRPSAD